MPPNADARYSSSPRTGGYVVVLLVIHVAGLVKHRLLAAVPLLA